MEKNMLDFIKHSALWYVFINFMIFGLGVGAGHSLKLYIFSFF